MKVTQHKDGTTTLHRVPSEMIEALTQTVADVGGGFAVLRYDTRWYDKWARPRKEYRKALLAFSKAIDDVQAGEWDDVFECLDDPKFAKYGPLGKLS